MEDREQNVCRVNGTCFRAATTRSLFLSLAFSSLYFSISFFLFSFLLREETLKHAPNWLMFKRARAFSWQQHLKLSIVFQSPCLGEISGGGVGPFGKIKRGKLVGKVGANEIL